MNSSEQDIAVLQGRWQQVGLEVDGVTKPADSESDGGVYTTFTGNEFFAHGADGTLLLAGAFTLDASTTPRSITWVDSMGPDLGKALPAIYALDGDDFMFIAAGEGAPRPAAFKTGPGETMRTMRRRND